MKSFLRPIKTIEEHFIKLKTKKGKRKRKEKNVKRK